MSLPPVEENRTGSRRPRKVSPPRRQINRIEKIINKTREDGWINAQGRTNMSSIPSYDSFSDPLCPLGTAKVQQKRNRESRLPSVHTNSSRSFSKFSRTSKYSTSGDIKFDTEASITWHGPQQPGPGITFEQDKSGGEVELLKSVILRDSYIEALMTVTSCTDVLDEDRRRNVMNLFTVLREVAVEIVELMAKFKQETGTSFLRKGENYAVKMLTDLAFLDMVPPVMDWVGHALRRNPLLTPYGLDRRPATPPGATGSGAGAGEGADEGGPSTKSIPRQLGLPPSLGGVDMIRLRGCERFLLEEDAAYEQQQQEQQQQRIAEAVWGGGDDAVLRGGGGVDGQQPMDPMEAAAARGEASGAALVATEHARAQKEYEERKQAKQRRRSARKAQKLEAQRRMGATTAPYSHSSSVAESAGGGTTSVSSIHSRTGAGTGTGAGGGGGGGRGAPAPYSLGGPLKGSAKIRHMAADIERSKEENQRLEAELEGIVHKLETQVRLRADQTAAEQALGLSPVAPEPKAAFLARQAAGVWSAQKLKRAAADVRARETALWMRREEVRRKEQVRAHLMKQIKLDRERKEAERQQHREWERERAQIEADHAAHTEARANATATARASAPLTGAEKVKAKAKGKGRGKGKGAAKESAVEGSGVTGGGATGVEEEEEEKYDALAELSADRARLEGERRLLEQQQQLLTKERQQLKAESQPHLQHQPQPQTQTQTQTQMQMQTQPQPHLTTDASQEEGEGEGGGG